jgi:hypothetical protein
MPYLDSNEAFLAELARRGIHEPDARPADPLAHLTPYDVRDCMGDYLRAQSGPLPRHHHPLVPALLRERVNLQELKTRGGMTTADFAGALGDGVKSLLVTKFANYTSDFRLIARDAPTVDFKPQDTVTLDLAAPGEVDDSVSLPALPVKVTAGQSGVLKTYAGTMSFSRAIWTTYGVEILAGIQSYASVFAAVEQQIIAGLLQGATLTTSASSALTVAGLEKVAKAMRVTEKNEAGQPCGLGIHAVIVPAALEMTARTLRAAMDGYPAHIVINPFLSSDTTWFAVANPALSAKLHRLTLRNSSGPSVYMDGTQSERMRFAVSHDCGYSITAQPGIIKATA